MASAPPVTPPKPGEERRRHQRKGLRAAAQVLLAGDQRFEVRLVDISAGGVAIVAPANPPAGLVCRVSWALPLRPGAAVPLEAEAQVMHSVFSSADGGFKIGLRFTALDPKVAQAIIQYLK